MNILPIKSNESFWKWKS